MFMNKIISWPKTERPREKLLKFGVEKLSNVELLAIFLRTGIKGKNAVELARDLMGKFNNLRELLNAEYDDFKEIKGLGPAKIAQLKAVLELSARYLRENIREKKWVDSSESVFRFLYHTMRDLDHEVFKVLFLNTQNEILETETLSPGTLTGGRVCPRQVISLALKHKAAGLIFAHNHPSGNPSPSRQDKKMTAEFLVICRLMEIRLLDHIIIGDNKYYSFAEKGLV
jgi:DNA repair protein RadC